MHSSVPMNSASLACSIGIDGLYNLHDRPFSQAQNHDCSKQLYCSRYYS